MSCSSSTTGTTRGAGTQVPAGRLDPGETLEECLLRELDEEAGLRGRDRPRARPARVAGAMKTTRSRFAPTGDPADAGST